MPIKLFVINNSGYHQIRQTQTNFFNGNLVGVGPDSSDLGFPSIEKLADAFGLPYFRLDQNASLQEDLVELLGREGAFICEVVVTIDQKFEPKSSAKKLPDGRIVSPPLEDMAPFLSREELAENMMIPLWEM